MIFLGGHKSAARHGCAILRLDKRLQDLVAAYLAILKRQPGIKHLSREAWLKCPVFCSPTGRPLGQLGNIVASETLAVSYIFDILFNRIGELSVSLSTKQPCLITNDKINKK